MFLSPLTEDSHPPEGLELIPGQPQSLWPVGGQQAQSGEGSLLGQEVGREAECPSVGEGDFESFLEAKEKSYIHQCTQMLG